MEMLTSSVVRARHGFTNGRTIVLMMELILIAPMAVTPVAMQQVLAQTQNTRKAQAD